MHELKLQIQKTRGQFPPKDEVDKIFRECVTDQVKAPQALRASFKQSIGPEVHHTNLKPF